MEHKLMELPFAEDAFEPIISKETIQYHHGKHHSGYVAKLNTLIKDTEFEQMALTEIIVNAEGGIFNNAAQVFNHDFYWMGLSMDETTASPDLMAAIERDFGSLESLKKAFLEKAAGLFGSGWTWLSLDADKKLIIEQTSNAANPLVTGNKPLLTCDVWEHAYYIDYRNARPLYLEKWWSLINWSFVSANYDKAV